MESCASDLTQMLAGPWYACALRPVPIPKSIYVPFSGSLPPLWIYKAGSRPHRLVKVHILLKDASEQVK
jgi:hypothetical protein